ncbi:unnamed protein product [Urochloa decumbens]|uniref:F-box domain-containing protein n=1 Tax=Urochloa decumbens TaxID=240449 RepID=A0ABC8YZ48_9POAL
MADLTIDIEGIRSAFPGGHFPGQHPPAPNLSSAVAATPAADGVDRISALPDGLLLDVVSRLPVRDAARTAVLASRWRGLWRAAPLVLRDFDLLTPDGDRGELPEAAVGRILADHPGPFRDINLSHCSLATGERALGDWARHLAAKGVQDLIYLDNPPLYASSSRPLPSDIVRCSPLHRLPADILRCASLRRLFLATCVFPDTTSAPRGADVFPHLKEFSMLSGTMSEHNLEHILACSPELETLALIINNRTNHIRIRSQSLKCMVLWVGVAKELAVVDAPHLERLILRETGGDARPMILKIGGAPELRVLGRLNPRFHTLQIGNTIINAKTKASPSCIVPSVKILALEVNFGVSKNASKLTSFLRCFPNVETLHIVSSRDSEASGGHHVKVWQEVDPSIKCVKSHVNNIIVHEYQGEQSEFGFVKFIAKHAQKLQFFALILTEEVFASAGEVHKVNCQLRALATGSWAADECQVFLMGPKSDNTWSFAKASDLSVEDPFL